MLSLKRGRGSLGLAKLTLTVRPPISAWFIASMAFSAASLVWKATKPNPLGAKPLCQEAAGGRVRHVGQQDAGHGSNRRHRGTIWQHAMAIPWHITSQRLRRAGVLVHGAKPRRGHAEVRGSARLIGPCSRAPAGKTCKREPVRANPTSHHPTARAPEASQRAASQNGWERGKESYLLRPVSRSKTTLACSISPNSWKTCQAKHLDFSHGAL